VAVTGQSVLSGATGTGDVVTGLNRVDAFLITVAGASRQGASVNETLPLASGTVTAVVETNDSTFNWIAIGS
jgi:hypothetical protein